MAKQAQVEIVLKMIDKTSRGMGRVSSASKKLSQQMKQLGTSMTRNVTLPIVAIGGAMVKVFADFDKTMTNIEARTGATAAQMEKIREVAIRMGRDTAFSANQAGDAMLELMASGSSVEEAISTLPHVLNLASAGQIELGRSSDIVTDILAQFGKGVERAENVVNDLAAGAQSSSADIESLAQGFANVGPIARNFNIGISQTTAILAVFAENGIKGAEAGTQLKSMLTAMSRQTKKTSNAWNRLNTSMFDASGNVKAIDVIIKDINKGLVGMTEQERIATIQDLAGSFGQMGLSALLAEDGIDKMLGKMGASQTASQVAKKQMESFNGAVNQLSGSLQTFAIVVIGPFVKNTLQPMIEGITKVINAFTDWAAENEKLATALVGIAAGLALIGPLLLALSFGASVFGMMASGLGVLTGGVTALATAIPILTAVLTTVLVPVLSAAATAFTIFWAAATGPVGLAALAITGFILAVAKFNPVIGGIIEQLGVILRQGLGNVKKLMEQIVTIVTKTISRAVEALFQLGAILMFSLGEGIVSAAKAVIQAVSDVGNFVINTLQGIFGIASPSKIMGEVGNNLGTSMIAGMAKGVRDNIGKVGFDIKPISGISGGLSSSIGGGRVPSLVPATAPPIPIPAGRGFNGGGAGGGGDLIIDIHDNNFAGTPKQQAKELSQLIAKDLKRRGITGISVG